MQPYVCPQVATGEGESCAHGLTFICLYVSVFTNEEVLHEEALRIVVRADGVLQRARRDQVALRHVAWTDDELTGVGRHLVRVAIEVAADRIHLHALVDVAGNDAIEVALLGEVAVVVVCRFVAQEEGALHVLLDGVLVGCDGEEEFVEAADVLAGLHGTVGSGVLTEGEDERLAVVQDVDLLPLTVGKGVRRIDDDARNDYAQHNESGGVEPDLLE